MISSRPSPLRFLRPPRWSPWSAGCLVAGTAGLALSAHAQFSTFGGDPSTNAFIRIPSDTDDWTRHFRLGAMAGLNIKANFSMAGTFPISGNNPGAGTFSDGYVLPDATGDKNLTANWGYNNANQLTPNTLTMTGANNYTASGNSSANGGAIPGFDLAYGGNLWYWKHARVGWEMGFGWLPIDIKSSQTLTAQVSQTTYTYDLSGLQGVPGAPYTGHPNGNGPLIPLNGTQGPTTISQGVVSGTHELDVDLYTLRLGPSIYWDITENLGVSFGAGPAIGVVNGNYKYNEVVTANGISTPNSGQIGSTQLTFGGYLSTALMYHLVANGDLYLGAQYMPMENTTISGDGRSGQLNLNGQLYLSVGINWPF